MSALLHMDIGASGTWCGVSAPKHQRTRNEALVTCNNCKDGLRIAKDRIEREALKRLKRKAP